MSVRSSLDGYFTSWLHSFAPLGCTADEQQPGLPLESPELERAFALFRAAYSRDHVRRLASAWAGWAAFADHHDLDAEAPTDADLVAFIQARASVGASFGTLSTSLTAIRTRVEGTPSLAEAGSLTVAATRHLSDLFAQG